MGPFQDAPSRNIRYCTHELPSHPRPAGARNVRYTEPLASHAIRGKLYKGKAGAVVDWPGVRPMAIWGSGRAAVDACFFAERRISPAMPVASARARSSF